MGLGAMITVSIDASGPIQMLGTAGQNLGDMTEPIGEILKSALSDAKATVETSSGAWPPMSSFTAGPPDLLQRLGIMRPRDTATLLHDQGLLAASLAPGGPNNVLRVTPTEGEAGTADPKATWQQEGTSRVFGVLQFFASRGRTRIYITPGIPARPFLEWSEEKLPDYDAILARHVLKGVDES